MGLSSGWSRSGVGGHEKAVVVAQDFHFERSGGIGSAGGVPERKQLHVHPLRREFEQTGRAEAQFLVVREGYRATVDKRDAVPVFQPFLVRVAG